MAGKNIVIIYGGDDWSVETPFKDSPETGRSFEDFYAYAKQRGISTYRASIDWYDDTSGTFLKAWTFDENTWVHIEQPVRPDVVFDKTAGKRDYALFDTKRSMLEKFPVVNSPLFRTQFDNKLSQYLAFSDFMPVSFLTEDDVQLAATFEKIRTEKVVMKEVYGSGGKEVTIGGKSLTTKGTLTYPLLVQEFVETAGIPRFSNPGDIADLRLVYVSGKLVYALSRIAKRGSLFTNFHQGASAVLVPADKIPEAALQAAEGINKKLSLFDNINYSLDFMFDTDGCPVFIEMNTTPGFDLLRIVGTPEIKERYYSELLDSFFKKNA
jgi:glutathione synthase/RimK-type ligase-like ATP-grasp enzyme